MDMNLREAVAKGKKGDRAAFAQIYDATNQIVYYTALKIVGNESDAQDLVQETYIRVFQNLGTLQDEEALFGWLKTITANLCKNYLKKKIPLLFGSDEEQDRVIGSIPEIDEDFLPEDYVQNKEKSRLVMHIIDGLPELQRAVVLLYYYDDLSVGEIAAIMETSDGTIKSRLNYARKQIKDEVEKLEKHDIKLYSVPAMPLIALLLHNDAKNCFLPQAASQAILAQAADAGVKALGGGHAAGPLSSAFHSFMASSVVTKMVAAVAAVGLVTGGAAGVVHLAAMTHNRSIRTTVDSGVNETQKDGNQESMPGSAASQGSEETSEKGLVTAKLQPETLLGKTGDEVLTQLGEPFKREDGKYTYLDSSRAELVLDFKQDTKTVFDITYDGNLLPFGDLLIPVGESADSVRSALSRNSAVEKIEDGGMMGSTTIFNFYKGGCKYEVLSGSDSKVFRVIVAAWDKQGDKAAWKQACAAYFNKNYRMKNGQAFFADLTHDGQDEMLVTYGDGLTGNLDVVAFDQNLQGKVIFTESNGTTTNQMYNYRLYKEDGRDYLMTDAYFGRQGANLWVYDIFGLSQDGKEQYLHQKSLEGDYTDDNEADDVPEAELNKFDQELANFKKQSLPLIILDNGDLKYAPGENFTSGPDGRNMTSVDGLILQDDTTLFTFLGRTDTTNGWERLYDGLEITNNEGAWDSFHITSGAYTARGLYVGEEKEKALEALSKLGVKQKNTDNGVIYILSERPESLPDARFIIWLEFSGNAVSGIYYQAGFFD